jgi:hypothetical protein
MSNRYCCLLASGDEMEQSSFLFFMKWGSPNTWKVDQIWQWVRSSQESYHYILCISIGASPESKILFSYMHNCCDCTLINTLHRCFSLIAILLYEVYCISNIFVSFILKLLDDLKQRNKSRISETSIVFFLYGNWYQRNITEVGCKLRCCYVTKWALNIFW